MSKMPLYSNEFMEHLNITITATEFAAEVYGLNIDTDSQKAANCFKLALGQLKAARTNILKGLQEAGINLTHQ